jgi:periplasmic protein TonB
MTHTCAAALTGLVMALAFDSLSALGRGMAASPQNPPGRRSVPATRAVPPQPPVPSPAVQVPLVADHSEIPALENDAVAPAPGASLPKCRTCDPPVWPSPVTERWRFRLHVVIDPAGNVGTVRIVQTLVGDPAARPVGAMGDVAPGLIDTPSARAGLAVLAAARQWRFDPPADAPLLLVTDVGVGDDVRVPAGAAPVARRASDVPLSVGGAIKPPTKIADVPPVYPPQAIAARITGTVTIEAVIDPAGNVSSARVIEGVPMLDDAALAAVRQWKYTPTLVNGEAVAVVMTVTSRFALQ